MDFELTQDQKMLREMVRDFAVRELEPIAAEIDEESKYPAEAISKMAGLGLMGLGISQEHGGEGGETELAIAIEEIARVCAGVSLILAVHSGLAGYAIDNYGSEAQKKKYLTPEAEGKKLGAFALTEAGAGSDPASIETTATRIRDGYLLNGTKVFVSNGAEGDTVVVFASLDRSLRHKGIAAFIVSQGSTGLSRQGGAQARYEGFINSGACLQ